MSACRGVKKPLSQALNLMRPFPKRADFKDEDQYLNKSELEKLYLGNSVRSEMSTKKTEKFKVPMNGNVS